MFEHHEGASQEGWEGHASESRQIPGPGLWVHAPVLHHSGPEVHRWHVPTRPQLYWSGTAVFRWNGASGVAETWGMSTNQFVLPIWKVWKCRLESNMVSITALWWAVVHSHFGSRQCLVTMALRFALASSFQHCCTEIFIKTIAHET